MRVRAKLQGARQVENALKRLPKATSKSVLRSTLKKAAKPIEAEAESRVRVVTGSTKESIKIGTVLSKSQRKNARRYPVNVYVGVSTPTGAHGHNLEFGTSKTSPQPFLRPAWNATKNKALQIFVDNIWKSIAKSAKTLRRKAESGKLGKSAKKALR